MGQGQASFITAVISVLSQRVYTNVGLCVEQSFTFPKFLVPSLYIACPEVERVHHLYLVESLDAHVQLNNVYPAHE